jgi:hypothetical protein
MPIGHGPILCVLWSFLFQNLLAHPFVECNSGLSRNEIVVVADDTSEPTSQQSLCRAREAIMVADTGEIFGVIFAFLFVIFTLGFVAYALVRPFTHREHEHRSDLWVHLP